MADLDLGGRRDERSMLTGFLDWYRAVVERKVLGLSLDDATRVMTSSGLSPLGVVQHLAHVERSWFRCRFSGEDVARVYDEDGGNRVQFRIEPGTTVESVLALYRTEVEQARRITAATVSLDQVSERPHPILGNVSLRWILVGMIEETARHAGHLDILREQIDGVTGD